MNGPSIASIVVRHGWSLATDGHQRRAWPPATLPAVTSPPLVFSAPAVARPASKGASLPMHCVWRPRWEKRSSCRVVGKKKEDLEKKRFEKRSRDAGTKAIIRLARDRPSVRPAPRPQAFSIYKSHSRLNITIEKLPNTKFCSPFVAGGSNEVEGGNIGPCHHYAPTIAISKMQI